MNITIKDWVAGMGLLSFGIYILGSLLLLLMKFVSREDIPNFMMMGYVFNAFIFFVTVIIQKFTPEILKEKVIENCRGAYEK